VWVSVCVSACVRVRLDMKKLENKIENMYVQHAAAVTFRS